MHDLLLDLLLAVALVTACAGSGLALSWIHPDAALLHSDAKRRRMALRWGLVALAGTLVAIATVIVGLS